MAHWRTAPDSGGVIVVTETSTQTCSGSKEGVAITGDCSLTQNASSIYAVTETASNFTLTEGGSLNAETEETGNHLDSSHDCTSSAFQRGR